MLRCAGCASVLDNGCRFVRPVHVGTGGTPAGGARPPPSGLMPRHAGCAPASSLEQLSEWLVIRPSYNYAGSEERIPHVRVPAASLRQVPVREQVLSGCCRGTSNRQLAPLPLLLSELQRAGKMEGIKRLLSHSSHSQQDSCSGDGWAGAAWAPLGRPRTAGRGRRHHAGHGTLGVGGPAVNAIDAVPLPLPALRPLALARPRRRRPALDTPQTPATLASSHARLLPAAASAGALAVRGGRRSPPAL